MQKTKFLGVHKYFDEKLHQKYDIPARKKVLKVFGSAVKENPETYEQDFIILEGKKYKYLEVQVCSTWTNKFYPHKNITIYERKGKYGNDTLFLTLSKNLTHGYLFDLEGINRNKPRRQKKYSREFVYDIPWRNAIRIEMSRIDELDIETLINA